MGPGPPLERYLESGAMMPADGIEQLSAFDTIFLGAVGFPTVLDHVSLWGLLIPIRREFQQYINLRPVRLFEGMQCPLAGKKPGDIDFYVVRENCEGEYSNIGGRLYEGTEKFDELITHLFAFPLADQRRGCPGMPAAAEVLCDCPDI